MNHQNEAIAQIGTIADALSLAETFRECIARTPNFIAIQKIYREKELDASRTAVELCRSTTQALTLSAHFHALADATHNHMSLKCRTKAWCAWRPFSRALAHSLRCRWA